MRGDREGSKQELMRRYFIEGLNHASGGEGEDDQAPVRQIFYHIRAFVNLKHGVLFSEKHDYVSFTQRVVTRMIEECPEIEKRILFEAKGSWLNPFTGREYALSTENVTKIITRDIGNRIYVDTDMVWDIPDNLQFNQVLFIEKQGFNKPFKKHGLIDELNLGLMSSGGFGTRATKLLMEYFINQGITVNILTDCDIAGYLIASKFESGSKTFKESLDVQWIGLTLEDVDGLGKRGEAEDVTYKVRKNKGKGNVLYLYDKCLGMLTKEEFDFLVVDKKKNKYKRIELNTLSIPELINLIKSKIKVKPIKPTLEQLQNYIEIDEDEIINLGLRKAFGSEWDVDVDIDEVARRVRKAINKQEHWTTTLEGEIKSYKEEKAEELVEEMRLSAGGQEP